MSSDRESVIGTLREYGALLEGHFRLASGRHSGHYVQVARIQQHPRALAALLKGALASLEFGSFDLVVTAAVGGLAVGQQVGLIVDKRTIFAERKGGPELRFHRGFEVAAGERVLLVEDVVTTGGTLSEMRGLVEEAEASVVAVFTVINRSGSEEWEGTPMASVLAASFPTYESADCPLCREGLPIERPGTKNS